MRSANRRGERRKATSSMPIKKAPRAARPGRFALTTSRAIAPMNNPVPASEASDAMKIALIRLAGDGAARRSHTRSLAKSLT